VISFGSVAMALTMLDKWNDNNIMVTAFINAVIVACGSSFGFEIIKNVFKTKEKDIL
jgi:hypothetical protein